MKFIHTADWHLGNRMYGINRYEEYADFFIWLKNEIEKQNAGTLIVSGDIYDTTNPPVESRTQYIDFLSSLKDTCCRNVIIIGGNHDSAALLNSEKSILEFSGIHVVGSIANIKTDDMIFDLYDEDGNVSAVCCAVPYAREAELRRFFDGDAEDGIFSDKAYGKLYADILERAKIKRGEKDIPIIATGHLYAANLEGRLENFSSEKKSDDGTRLLDVVGNLGSVHSSVFQDDFDYVALGHIHYATMVNKNPKIRYSGSPFVMGFDEANVRHNILSVEIDGNHNASVEKIPVPDTFCYRRISGRTKDIIDELLKYKKNPPEKKTYVEAYFVQEDGVSIHDEIELIESSLPENVYVVNKKAQPALSESASEYSSVDMDELKNFDETEIFKRLILAKEKDLYADLNEDEQKKKKDDLIEKYLPLFQMIASEVEGEIN